MNTNVRAMLIPDENPVIWLVIEAYSTNLGQTVCFIDELEARRYADEEENRRVYPLAPGQRLSEVRGW